jgi:hypothetical protein
VVVDDFNVVRVTVFPSEADSPLVIDPDTVLSGPIVPQFFQSITRRYSHFVYRARVVEHSELPSCGVLNIGREPFRLVTTPDILSRL